MPVRRILKRRDLAARCPALPQIRQVLSDPNTLRDMMRIASNPVRQQLRARNP